MAAELQPPAKPGAGRFAATCGLLRRYMKEQSANGLQPVPPMRLLPGADAAAAADGDKTTTTTMELFPQHAGTLHGSHERTEEPKKAQLTIFYSGKVLVLDDFPADKAGELMRLAGSDSSPAKNAAVSPAPAQPGLSDMPIARKASLQRFLEKRKSRLNAGDPYQAPGSLAARDSAKTAKGDAAPWLGLGSTLSLS